MSISSLMGVEKADVRDPVPLVRPVEAGDKKNFGDLMRGMLKPRKEAEARREPVREKSSFQSPPSRPKPSRKRESLSAQEREQAQKARNEKSPEAQEESRDSRPADTAPVAREEAEALNEQDVPAPERVVGEDVEPVEELIPQENIQAPPKPEMMLPEDRVEVHPVFVEGAEEAVESEWQEALPSTSAVAPAEWAQVQAPGRSTSEAPLASPVEGASAGESHVVFQEPKAVQAPQQPPTLEKEPVRSEAPPLESTPIEVALPEASSPEPAQPELVRPELSAAEDQESVVASETMEDGDPVFPVEKQETQRSPEAKADVPAPASRPALAEPSVAAVSAERAPAAPVPAPVPEEVRVEASVVAPPPLPPEHTELAAKPEAQGARPEPPARFSEASNKREAPVVEPGAEPRTQQEQSSLQDGQKEGSQDFVKAGPGGAPEILRAARPAPAASAGGDSPAFRVTAEAPVPAPAAAAPAAGFAGSLRTERLHELMERLDQHVLSMVKGHGREMSITLEPANLGKVTLNCRDDGQRLAVEIVAETQVVRNLLEQQEASLRQVLEQNGYKMGSFDVVTQEERDQHRPFERQAAPTEEGRQAFGAGRRGAKAPASEPVEAWRPSGSKGIWVVA